MDLAELSGPLLFLHVAFTFIKNPYSIGASAGHRETNSYIYQHSPMC